MVHVGRCFYQQNLPNRSVGFDLNQTAVRAPRLCKLRCSALLTSVESDGGPPIQMCLLHNRFLRLVLIAGLTFLSGCSLSGQQQLESSLRQSQASVRDLKHQLAEANSLLKDQEAELQALRQPQQDSPFHSASSARVLETDIAWGAVEQLRVHTLASGVLREDDGSLTAHLVIQPLDHDGEVVKVAGELSIRLQQPGAAALLEEKSLTALEGRRAWTSGIVARGFQVRLPLDGVTLESGDEILVTATLDLGQDRDFTATELLPIPE